jgi:hypothetical protein
VSAQNKRKGSLWEADLENYYNMEGFKARRLPRAGAKDIGDIAIELKNNHVVVVEAKNVKANDVLQWLREADIEAEHYTQKYDVPTYGIVVRKTRGTNPSGAVVMMSQETLQNLLRWNGLT